MAWLQKELTRKKLFQATPTTEWYLFRKYLKCILLLHFLCSVAQDTMYKGKIIYHSKCFPDTKAVVTFNNKSQLNSLGGDYDNAALFSV